MSKGKSHEIPIEHISKDRPRPVGEERDPAAERAPAPTPERAASSPQETLEQLQRLQAEFTNYRRRIERERLETVTWAQRSLLEKLIPVLEDLDRAMASVEGDVSPAAQGLALLNEKIQTVLAEAGLERIDSVGEAFDPSRHEAVTTQPVEPHRVGTVLAELVPGFTFRGKLVRPARVQVGVEGTGMGDSPYDSGPFE
jgi:molecular chaperone GrpE